MTFRRLILVVLVPAALAMAILFLLNSFSTEPVLEPAVAPAVPAAPSPSPKIPPSPVAVKPPSPPAPPEPEPIVTPPVSTPPVPVSPLPAPPTAAELAAKRSAMLKRANDAIVAGKVAVAISRFQAVLATRPTDSEARRGLALAYTAGRQYDKAIPLYRALLADEPSLAAERFNLATAYARLGKITAAETQYLELLRQHPKHIEGRCNLALLYSLAEGKLHAAKAQWILAIQAAPNHARAHTGLADTLTELQDNKAALVHYARAAHIQKTNAPAYLAFAVSAARAGSAGRAILAVRKALARQPRQKSTPTAVPLNATELCLAGDLLLELHRETQADALLPEAVAAWKRSLEANPDQPALKKRIKAYSNVAETP